MKCDFVTRQRSNRHHDNTFPPSIQRDRSVWISTLWRLKIYCPRLRTILTLNVPGDCGSSRPTRVEPRLHCVDIEWQVRGRCVGSAAHSPLHAIAARALKAARAIEPRPTHFARVRALAVPGIHNAARALCVGPRTLRGPAHLARLAAHALISFSMQLSTHLICYPSKSRPMLSKANTIFLTQGRNQNRLHNLLIMPQIRQSSNRTDGFLTSWHFKTLRNIEICT